MRLPRAAGAAAAGAGALAAYALLEPYRFRFETNVVPVGPRAPQLSVLHLSDTHLRGRGRRLISFLNGLADRVEVPDLVLATGDMIEDDTGIDPIVDCLNRFEARLGRFYVLGSHDYYQSKFRLPTKYFLADQKAVKARPADVGRLEEGLQAKDWKPLTNRTEFVATAAGTIRLAGVDDPYLKRERTEHIERRRDEVLAVALVHSPDVVSEWALHGFDLIVAGHTHGGQVRLPGVGAVVTNCSLPAGLAFGLNRVGNCWLHVTAGLGTSRFTPIRFGCRPEATLLQLEPAAEQSGGSARSTGQ